MNIEKNTAAAIHSRIERVHKFIERDFANHLSILRDFLRIASVSTNTSALRRTAAFLKDRIDQLGGEVKLVGNLDSPTVYGRFNSNRPKTLLVYGMYDVQPASSDGWVSPPFGANILTLPDYGLCVIARGACNSKGPLIAFLNVLTSIMSVDQLPLNLILTAEGEEEAGSPGLVSFYREEAESLKADAAFEPFWAEYGTDFIHPVMSVGSKGIVSLELICRGGSWGGPISRPLHSSVGGWLASPTWRLAKAVATLVNENDEIAIEGFQEEIAPPRDEDEELLLQLQKLFDKDQILRNMGAARFRNSRNTLDLLRKYFFSPTLNVAFEQNGNEDVIPISARAKLSIRLVPDMSPDRTVGKLREHLARNGFEDIEVVKLGGYPASRTSSISKVFRCMLGSYRHHGYEPAILPLLASATPYYLFSDVLKIPYVWGGLGRAGGSHSVNEFATVEGLKLFEQSLVTFIYYFAESFEGNPSDNQDTIRP